MTSERLNNILTAISTNNEEKYIYGFELLNGRIVLPFITTESDLKDFFVMDMTNKELKIKTISVQPSGLQSVVMDIIPCGNIVNVIFLPGYTSTFPTSTTSANEVMTATRLKNIENNIPNKNYIFGLDLVSRNQVIVTHNVSMKQENIIPNDPYTIDETNNEFKISKYIESGLGPMMMATRLIDCKDICGVKIFYDAELNGTFKTFAESI